MDKSFRLEAVNALGETVRTAKERSYFVGNKNYFRIDPSEAAVKLTTPRGVYYLKKDHRGIYAGSFKGVKIEISLQKVVGTISYH